MVTGLAMIWKEGRFPVPSVFYQNSDGEMGQINDRIPHVGEEIAACGLASALVHRDVFEALEAPRHPDYRWFDFLPNREVGINGDEMTGIDVQFFVRARQQGFKLLMQPEAQTWHLEDLAIGLDEWKKSWATPQMGIVFAEAARILDAMGVTWWLSSGTLLGAVREGRLLPWDGDIDIGIWPKDVPAVRAAFIEEGWPFHRDYETQLWPYKDGVKIDIHPHFTEGDVVFKVHGVEQNLRMDYPAHLFSDMGMISFYGRTVLIPSPAEEYLATQYGEGWRTPVQKWDWRYSPLNMRER
jgi:hypothetical protein